MLYYRASLSSGYRVLFTTKVVSDNEQHIIFSL